MLKVGIIGASFARDAYLPAFAHLDGARVVALASGRIDSARDPVVCDQIESGEVELGWQSVGVWQEVAG